MRVADKKIKKLLDKYREIYLLGKINAVLEWDLNVNLPPKGGEGRAGQSAYLAKITTEKWLDPEFRSLLEKATKEIKNLGTEEKAIVRNLNWTSKYYYKVPKEIIVEFAEASSRAFMAWQKAKEEDNFSDFLPFLKKNISLNQIIAKHLGYKENPYDALLDLYEPGLTTQECKKIFGVLQPELTKILRKIAKKVGPVDGVEKSYSIDSQKQLALFALRKIGYDLDAGMMDVSSHPFTDTLGRFDVRITNRYKTTDFRESLMAGMHEGGHGLYEQGVNEDYEGTPLDGGISLGIHESQSRFWENQIGRSKAFLKFMTPIFHAFYSEQLGKVGSDELFKMFNNVRPSFIRTESDEVTYNLHIALRFELEEAMVNAKIKAENLPEIWREKMKKYLGIAPETDRDGVLQDIHWSHGSMGYFPTYTLGNLYSAQFTAKMKKEIDIEAASENGELGPILSWLRTNIHQYGSLYWPKDLVKKVTGEELDPKYFLEYLKKKYGKIYKVSL